MGLGRIVYAMVKTAEFLGDQTLVADARRCAELITSDAIAQDRHLDVLLGSAGTLLSLLALHRVEPDARILEQAIDCGQHLLAKQVECEAGGRAWNTLDGKPLTGFSHGAAGGIQLAKSSCIRRDHRKSAPWGAANENSLILHRDARRNPRALLAHDYGPRIGLWRPGPGVGIGY